MKANNRQAWNKGKKCPQISGKKNGMYGKKRPDLIKRNKSLSQRNSVINYNKNRVLNKNTKLKMSASNRSARLKEKNWQKEKNPSWKGGKTSEIMLLRTSIEYKLWRLSVFKRDNFRCIWCNSNKRIEADHIKPFAYFPELRFAIDNGRTLCHKCHKTTQTYLNKGRQHERRKLGMG